MAWSSRARRGFKQSRNLETGLGIKALRSRQIAAIRAAGVDDAYAARGVEVTPSMLIGNIRKRRAAALDWLDQNPSRVLSREAFDALKTGIKMTELK
jgi:hypothetical protein